MSATAETKFVGAVVPKDLADDLGSLARSAERSTAAELRLAIKAWVDARASEKAA